MRNIRAAVAAFAASGLAAFGALAATGGVANAAQDLSITGCSINSALVGVQILPTCEAADGTIYNATEVTATVDPSFLQAFVGHITGIGVEVRYDLVCSVDGKWVTAHEHFQANDPHHNWQVVDLQQAVGSPEPNQCTVKDLRATSLASVTLLNHQILGFGVSVKGDNGVPGAIWAQYPNSTSGAGSTVCADDTANGNAGTQMCVGRRGLFESGRLHSLAQCLNIVYFVSKMIYAWKAPVRCPGFLGLRVRWTQGNVGFICAHVNPSGAVPTFAFAAHPKLRKRRLQETDHPFDITYSKVLHDQAEQP